MKKPNLPPHRPRPKTSYALFLTDDDTGKIILDLHNIPEYVVEQIAMLLGRAMPLVAGVRALQQIGDSLHGALEAFKPPTKRRRAAR